MRLSYRNLVLALMGVSSTLFFITSCQKDLKRNVSPDEKKIIAFPDIIIPTREWIDLRNQARDEYDFYFGDYYHSRNFLKEVDWSRAVLSEKEGQKIMVFLFKPDGDIKTDARLMVVRNPDGKNTYSIRIRSAETEYTSLYTANDHKIYVGKVNNEGAFVPMVKSTLKGQVIGGVFDCKSCHNDEDEDWEDPVPGGGSIWDNNWLDDVEIVGQADSWDWTQDTGWDGPVVVIPDEDNNVDANPCNEFESLMANPQLRAKLQELINNTTLNAETAVTFNGTAFSPFAFGNAFNPQVDYTISSNTIFDGHSHYYGLSPTFTPGDLREFYGRINGVADFMGYVSAVATPYGTYMIKLVDQNAFNAFAAIYLANQLAIQELSILYGDYGISNGTNTGDNLINLLNDKNAGLKIVKISNPNSPGVNCD